jgi:hypothetical protein
MMAETCWSEAEIPSEATCQGLALAKTEAAAGNTETLNLALSDLLFAKYFCGL